MRNVGGALFSQRVLFLLFINSLMVPKSISRRSSLARPAGGYSLVRDRGKDTSQDKPDGRKALWRTDHAP